jgi:hypothetical protein
MKKRISFCRFFLPALAAFFITISCTVPAFAATTGLHIVKYADDRSTVLAEKNLTYQEMRDTLPVQGDGSTHYFHQGPVFVDDPDEVVEQQLRWNPDEDSNVMEKDMGAVMGTSVKDLCDLVGGMSSGDTLVIAASDGLSREFAYKNVYTPPARQGPMVITWYCSGSSLSTCTGPYPDSGYSDGMRLVFFADSEVNPWGEHVFGNYDWHESADESYWYYYGGDAGELYPTTTGLSIKYVSEIRIYSSQTAPSSERHGRSSVTNLSIAGSAPPDDPDLYGYKGRSISSFRHGTLNGSIQLVFDPITEPVVANNRVREFNLTVDLPAESNITMAWLYTYISRSHNLQTKKGTVPLFYATLDTEHLEEDNLFIDTDGDENRDLAATYVYDVLPFIRKNGTYRLSIRNLDPEQSIFSIDGILLVTGYENATAPPASYWIGEGCDVISSIPKNGLFPDECTTDFQFAGKINTSTAYDADLYLISTGLDRDNRTEHTVKFNKNVWHNIFGNSSALDPVQLPVAGFLNETKNAVSIESSIRSQDADYIINRNAILIVKHNETGSSVQNSSVSGQGPLASSTGAPDSSPPGDESPSCQISVDSDPEGALVYIDGRYLGKTTPDTIDVGQGETHTVRFELDGYAPSDIQFVATNSTCIRTSLYTAVHSTKGRLIEEPEDPDGIQYGGLYVHSRPHSAAISINGIETGQVTPAVFMGLEPGRYTIRLGELQDITITENNLFDFPEQTVQVLPELMIPVDINGIGNHSFSEVIVDSRLYRGVPFTVNGYVNNNTIPAKITMPLFNSFITIHENESFISYPVPVPFVWDDVRYLRFEPRDHHDLSIAVNSSPRGAEVFIDGFRTGYATPYTFTNLSDGPHRITVTKEGYLPQESLIDLPRRSVPVSMTSVDFHLEEYPSGFLHVTSFPPGCKVSIDGLSTGEVTPALFKSLPTGAHMVRISGPNSTKTFYDVTVNSLNMVEVSENFTKSRDV